MFTPQQQQLIKDKLPQYLKTDAHFAVIYHKVRKDFDASGLPAHNWDHIFHDVCNAIVIGEAEQADMHIVLPAIAMHDIGFLYGGNSRTHGAIGAEKLSEFVASVPLTYTDVELDHIAACIRTHKGSSHDEHPETLEAKVVADSDLLDKFGPIGVYQGIRSFTESNWNIDKVLEKEDGIMGLKLETETGRMIADQGRIFVRDFYHELAEVYSEYPSFN